MAEFLLKEGMRTNLVILGSVTRKKQYNKLCGSNIKWESGSYLEESHRAEQGTCRSGVQKWTPRPQYLASNPSSTTFGLCNFCVSYDMSLFPNDFTHKTGKIISILQYILLLSRAVASRRVNDVMHLRQIIPAT